MFVEHLDAALLRGDLVSRYSAYQIARQNGAMNANEWRRKENENPIPGLAGNAYLVNGNMVPTERAAGDKPAPEPVAPALNPGEPAPQDGETEEDEDAPRED